MSNIFWGATQRNRTRLYLPSSGAAAVSPAFDAGWEETGDADRLAMVTTRINSTMTSKSATTLITAGDTLVRQYVSSGLAAQTISGNVRIYLRALEALGTVDAIARIVLKVVSGDGSTVTGTLLSLADYSTGAEFNTSLRNKAFADGDTPSSVAVNSGDRLVLEIGFHHAAVVSSGSLSFGDDSATDLVQDETTTTADNPWLEIGQVLTFLTTPTLEPTGIAGAEAFGTASVKAELDPSGIASSEAFGTPSVFAVVQDSFRFRNDDGSESGATWKASEDTDATANSNENFRLRVQVDTAGDLPSEQFQLEFKRLARPIFADDFTDNVFDTSLWEKHYWQDVAFQDAAVTVLETGGFLEITPITSAGDHANGVRSLVAYDFTNRNMAIKADQMVTSIGANTCEILWLTPDKNDGLGFYYEHGVLYFQTFIGGVSAFTSVAYNATTHAWMRIRHDPSDDTIKWETSSDGSSWTVQRSIARPLTITSVYLQPLGAFTYASIASPGVAKARYFSFNVNVGDWTAVGGATDVSWSASANIVASGANTTAQLTAPAGKTTADFVAGRIQDDENPADAVNITADDYTELEWCLTSATTNDYSFRVTLSGLTLGYAVTPSISVKDTIRPSGVASTETFGTASANVQVDNTGIASSEALGTPALTLTLNPSGIASSEAFGTASIECVLAPAAIGSGETLGTASAVVVLNTVGIASAEALGEPTVSISTADTVTDAGDIASAEAFGTASIAVQVDNTGLASTETFGVQSAVIVAAPSGIATAEAIGAPSTVVVLAPSGVASVEAFGTTSAGIVLSPTGIASAESVSAPSAVVVLAPSGVASGEAFGSSSAQVVLNPSGIASAEVLGEPTVVDAGYTISPTGIAGAEAFGTASLAIVVNVNGIASVSAFGIPVVATTDFLTDVGDIASAEVLGDAVVTYTLAPNGIASSETVSSPVTTLTLYPSGITSSEAFGTLRLTINPTGIPSEEALGTPTITYSLHPLGIASAEEFGNASVAFGLYPTGIDAEDAYGTPAAVAVLAPSSIASAELFGNNAAVGGAYARVTLAYSVNIVRMENTANATEAAYSVAASIGLSSQQINAADVGYSVIIVREEIRQ